MLNRRRGPRRGGRPHSGDSPRMSDGLRKLAVIAAPLGTYRNPRRPAGALRGRGENQCSALPDDVAWGISGTTIELSRVHRMRSTALRALSRHLASKAHDRILISMPTSPPGIIAFYAANRRGRARPGSIPPRPPRSPTTSMPRARVSPWFSTPSTLQWPQRPRRRSRLRPSWSRAHPDYLSPAPPVRLLADTWTEDREKSRLTRVPLLGRPRQARGDAGAPSPPPLSTGAEDPAAILFSGRHHPESPGHRAFQPQLHRGEHAGGGLGRDPQGATPCSRSSLPRVRSRGVRNAVLMAGGTSILVPVFSAQGGEDSPHPKAHGDGRVPTSMKRSPAILRFTKRDLSCLRACFSGADTLPRPVKERFEQLVARNGGRSDCSKGMASPRRCRPSWRRP